MAPRAKLAQSVERYLASRPRAARLLEFVVRRHYRIATFPNRPLPVFVIAPRGRFTSRIELTAHTIEHDWTETPPDCRESYEEILQRAPEVIVIQLRRTNVCGCLGHRHVSVKEIPFSEPREAQAGAPVGEMDIAYDRVESSLAQPLMETALDTQFIAGSRLKEFHEQQLRYRLLSVILHETHHMVAPEAAENIVRGRSLAFYRQALAHYVENARAELSFTIDRSFSRLGKD
jgi:hypothetical protein